MNCIEYDKYIAAYIDGEVDINAKHRLISHLKICNRCKMEYEAQLKLKGMLGRLIEYELPEGFDKNLRKQLIREDRIMKRKRPFWKITLGVGTAILAVFIIFISIKGIIPASKDAGMSDSAASYSGEMAYPREEAKQEEGDIADFDLNSVTQIDRKLIKTVHIDMETLEYDSTITALLAKVDMMQGYIESSNVKGAPKYGGEGSRYADFKIRIPIKRLDTFTDSLDNVCRGYNFGIL